MQSKLIMRIPPLTWIIVLGLILRVISLNQSVWLDEATSILTARNFSFFGIITQFSPGDFHPPFYYLLLKFWGSFFGWSELGARSLSVVLGLASIIVVYYIGKKIRNEKLGFWSALLLALSPLHIYYSQEARMYALETFLTCLVFWFFINLLEYKNKKHLWIGFSVSSILLAYTDYLPLFFIVATLSYLFFFEYKDFKNNRKKWLEAILPIGIIFAIWLPILIAQIEVGIKAGKDVPNWIAVLGKTNIKELALVPVKFIIGRISLQNKFLYGFLVTPVVVLFLANLIKGKTKLFWVWLLIPIILTAFLGWVFSGFSYFRLLFVLPAFYLLLVEGALLQKNQTSQRIVLTSIVAISLICSLTYLLIPGFHREDWKGAVAWIESQNKGEKVAAVFVTRNQRDPYLYYSKISQAFGPQDIMDNTYNKIYLMRYVQPIFDPNELVKKKIELLGYKKGQERGFNGVVFWEYTQGDKK